MGTAAKIRTVRAVVTVLAVVGTLGTFLLIQGETVDARNDPLAVPLAAWWVSALVPYHLASRTLAGSLVIGLGFLVALGAFLSALYLDESSTAALGLLTIPILLWGATLLSVLIERIAVERRRP